MIRLKTKRLACAASALAVATAALAALAVETAAATTGAGTTAVQVANLSGPDRVATSIAVSQGAFANAGSAKAVVVAQDNTYPDALAGGPLAAFEVGPLLLTDPSSISTATINEIKRVLPAGGPVYVLGGTSAISDTVSTAITNAGFVVHRVGGINRFATAVSIADILNPTTIFEATGTDFADALTAGPAASANHGAIVLTNGRNQAPETLAYLTTKTAATLYAIGGPAAAASPTAFPIVGTDRFATATAVADKFFPTIKAIGLVSGIDFPDALSAVPLLAEIDSPMILVNPTGSLPASVTSFLNANSTNVLGVVTFGGTSALSDAVINEVTSLLHPGSTSATTTTTTGSSSTTGSTTTSTTGGSGGLGSILSLLSGNGGLSALGGGGLTSLGSVLGV